MSVSVLDEYLAGQRQPTQVVVSVSGGKDSMEFDFYLMLAYI